MLKDKISKKKDQLLDFIDENHEVFIGITTSLSIIGLAVISIVHTDRVYNHEKELGKVNRKLEMLRQIHNENTEDDALKIYLKE